MCEGESECEYPVLRLTSDGRIYESKPRTNTYEIRTIKYHIQAEANWGEDVEEISLQKGQRTSPLDSGHVI